MTPEESARVSATPRRLRRTWVAACALAAAALCLVRFAADRATRSSAAEFAAQAGLGRSLRREIGVAPAGDLALDLAVSGVLRSPTPDTQRAANALMASAVGQRPGWAYHRYLLARSDSPAGGPRARRTMRLAAAAAPSLDAAWSALARADLEGWSTLSASERQEIPEIFRRATFDRDFVESEFSAMSAVLGEAPAIALLPAVPEVLAAGATSLAESGNVTGAASLLRRSDEAERAERERELVEMERRIRLGDVEGLYVACRAWFDRHPFEELDDTEGRRQLGRLLGLWPGIHPHSWSVDRRARLVRFFLDGRTADVPPGALARAVGALTGVPDAVRARVHLLAGEEAAALELERAAGASEDASWDPYFLERGRRALAAGRPAEARIALGRLSTGIREGCAGLRLRRAIAAASGDAADAAAADGRIEVLKGESAKAWSSTGTISVCLGPETARGSLDLTIGPGAPALVSYGWNGGRLGRVAVPSEGLVLRVPLTGLDGNRTLWTSFLIGGGDRSFGATLNVPS